MYSFPPSLTLVLSLGCFRGIHPKPNLVVSGFVTGPEEGVQNIVRSTSVFSYSIRYLCLYYSLPIDTYVCKYLRF